MKRFKCWLFGHTVGLDSFGYLVSNYKISPPAYMCIRCIDCRNILGSVPYEEAT